jgi:large subunit ribosomal protein L12
MEYVYAALILNETGEELNEDNITAVLDAAGVDVEESRVKALVAALEDVDIEEAIETAAAVPAAGGAARRGRRSRGRRRRRRRRGSRRRGPRQPLRLNASTHRAVIF